MTSALDSPQVAAFTAALLSLDRVAATRLLQNADSTMPRLTVVEQLTVPALDGIGQAWETGEVSLSQVYMSARICEELVSGLPVPAGSHRPDQPRVAIASLNDHHLLGKRIVQSMMSACGFDVADYGVIGVPELAARARADRIEILMISVLMLRSALLVRALRAELDKLGVRPHLIVGGAPFRFDANLWREVGADACGTTASDAVVLLERYARSS